ncbi:uncharacterized protein KY384_007200 [Bacidia gigantensis]|uniref:uncharacterized protein n=1 Tax=Bacidia gigantensis TaxID=2732470 RepID=UPI001D05428D|nr:uncharacterized protein KY384_007200 [Bacidia gigantensis]KAG8528283.1 hypothetical protein KY384_007200 [Bacidia gigantensis]
MDSNDATYTSHHSLSPGNTALITGAASGVGLAVAKLFYQKGMNIALADLNASALSNAQNALLSPSQSNSAASSTDTAVAAGMVKTYTIDVSSLSDWKDLKAQVGMDFGLIHVLMLNAGTMKKSGWEDVEYFQNPTPSSLPFYPPMLMLALKIMNTNYFGIINGISTFLPSLRKQEPASTSIIITGSKQGITNPPGSPAYNASKAAVKAVAEHLSYDLRDTGTDVFLLVPGWTWTGMTAGGRDGEKPEGAWWPEQVAGYLEKRMGERRFYVICPDEAVSEGMDRKRVLWNAGDLVEGRPPLSRWREGWKEEAEKWMSEQPG